MKIQQLEYVIAIAQEGSITRAAKKLFQAQPNLSTALKELENETGIQMFLRTATGMVPTPEGEAFISKARSIVEGLHQLTNEYSVHPEPNKLLHIAVTYSFYAADAVATVLNQYAGGTNGYEIHVAESRMLPVLEALCTGRAELGMLSVPESQLENVEKRLQERGLESRRILTYSLRLLMSKKHPLAESRLITPEKLARFPEITFGTRGVSEDVQNRRQRSINPDYQFVEGAKRIMVYDRGTQIHLMNLIPNAFMWAAPAPQTVLDAYGSTIRPCSYATNRNVDIIAWKPGAQEDSFLAACIEKMVDFASKLDAENHALDRE